MALPDLSPARRGKLSSLSLSLSLSSLFLLLSLAQPSVVAAPTTFGDTFGSALLCHDRIDNVYFHDYLTASFGPAYKREGGAYWFRAEASLWGTEVSEVIVSDNSSNLEFVGAVFEVAPGVLAEGVAAASGVRHLPADQSAFPVRQAIAGSKIVYFNTKSKLYCAKFQPPQPG